MAMAQTTNSGIVKHGIHASGAQRRVNRDGSKNSFWKGRGYLTWFASDSASTAGSTMPNFAIPLVAFALSRSVVTAGWVTTLMRIVQQGANLFGGTFIDRHDRKRLIIINCTVGTILWGSILVLLLIDRLTFGVFLVIVLCWSFSSGFLGGSADALLRSIINIRDYPKARSITEGRDATINLAGSSIGGAFYAIAAWLPFLVATALYAIAGITASQIKTSTTIARRHIKRKTEGMPFVTDFIQGWKYVLSSRLLVTLTIATALLNCGMNGIQYAIQLHLVGTHTNSALIGFTGTGTCIGLMAGSFIANRLSDRIPVGTGICLSIMLAAVTCLPLTVNDSYTLILACSAVIGLPFPLFNAMCFGFVFAKTPDALQGRVKSAMSVGVQALSMFSSAIAGTLLSHFAFITVSRIFILILIIAATLVFSSRRIRDIPAAEKWDGLQL